MTQVDLITGFLGAGKTTFIKKYADYLTAKGEKIHIIENEFGGFPIDAQTLREEHCDVSQLTGGCMCCTGRQAFQSLLLQAAGAGYDRVLVEPSGIYDVNSFFNLLTTAPVDSACTIGNVITIADSVTDEILSDEARYLMFSQLIYTGCVVVSKTQLRTESEISDALDNLQAVLRNHGSSRDLAAEDICITKPWEDFTDADFERVCTCGYRIVEHTYEIIDHMSVFSTSMIGGKFDTLDNLTALLHELVDTETYGKIYRVKGYISDDSGKWYELNCSASGCFVKESHVKRGIVLVIGQDYDEKAIKARFRSRI